MKPQYKRAYEQIRKLTSDKLYRFGHELLMLAQANKGMLTVNTIGLVEIYNGEESTARRALGELQKAEIIKYQHRGDLYMIAFCAWIKDGAA